MTSSPPLQTGTTSSEAQATLPPTESTVSVSERVLVSCRDVKDGERRREQTWEKATVRYVGQVDGQEGTWVGVEWDQAERGKHDGQTGGRQYFRCKKTWAPAPASFVREKRLKRGVTLVEAIREKYCGGLDSEDRNCEMFIHTSSGLNLPVTLVGQDSIVKQQSVLDELKAVYLNGSELSTVGPSGDVSTSVPKIVELDLSSTLLSSWQEVLKLEKELPELRLLDLSRNDIDWTRGLPSPIPAPATIFAHLRVLILNSCSCDWETIAGVAEKIPNLREVHLAGNRIASLASSVPISSSFALIEAIHLEDNLILDWVEIERLGTLPHLKRLNLSNNLLTEIGHYSAARKPAGFPSLQTLFLTDNCLNTWSDIDALEHFDCLTEVRVSKCDFLKDLDMIASRLGVIARLPKITRLNGSAVTAKERTDAEIGYLGEILTDAVGKEMESIEAAHPQFKRLLDSYGNINKNIVRGSGSGTNGGDRTTIGKTLLSLEIRLVESLANIKAIDSKKKKLPSNLVLIKAKALMQRLFKLSQAPTVFLHCEAPYELMHLEDTLQQLGVEDGQTLLVIDSS